jgi:hypothetical protein
MTIQTPNASTRCRVVVSTDNGFDDLVRDDRRPSHLID